MPRLRRIAETGGLVPVELLDRSNSLWATEKATRAWFKARGVPVPEAVKWGPLNRHREAVRAWAVDAGWTVTYGSYRRPDLKRLADAGVPVADGSGYIRERLTFAGVVFE